MTIYELLQVALCPEIKKNTARTPFACFKHKVMLFSVATYEPFLCIGSAWSIPAPQIICDVLILAERGLGLDGDLSLYI